MLRLALFLLLFFPTLLPAQTPEKLPIEIGYNNSYTYGLKGNKILKKADEKDQWTYCFTLPYFPGNGNPSLVSDRLQYATSDSLFSFDLSGKLKKKVASKDLVKAFTATGIQKIIFSYTVGGCFSYSKFYVAYSPSGKNFGNPKDSGMAGYAKKPLPEYPPVIKAEVIDQFINKLPLLLLGRNTAKLEDLAFTEADYKQCKKDILEFKEFLKHPNEQKIPLFTYHWKGLDFDLLTTLVDAIRSVDAGHLRDLLASLAGRSSTDYAFKEILLVNKQNEQLTFQTSDLVGNPFCLPWTISLNGFTIETNDFMMNRMIGQIYPGFIDPKQRRVIALHAFVKQLYEQQKPQK
ncbi:MAG: hypothetical protein P0Y53_06720 [Candidatus Pseudobacter hemicellulosilyticus]|uniref:Uncharacterized protein n=1 Tax=Candidatus Pseudobacter hemicellulosilyticus TaxID=3121375 RepID=A0AAJ6BHG2_9BACT|nr:MAG: hypothetical protein P0Y53_06720 [Pseudobacter sp.]